MWGDGECCGTRSTDIIEPVGRIQERVEISGGESVAE
mgnify:CR=1 FL=1